MVQFDDSLEWTFVMGGLARDLSNPDRRAAGSGEQQVYGGLIREWLVAAEATGMPYDPLLWVEGPVSTSYPACMAFEAAAEQVSDGGYGFLRRLREGLMCERRKLDHAEALVEEARRAGLDVERFRFALRSHAITEALGADLERTTALAEPAEPGAGGEPDGEDLAGEGEPAAGRFSRGAGGTPLPTLVFQSPAGETRSVVGFAGFDDFRTAAEAVGARQIAGPPRVEELVARFGRVATREVEVVCELPGPRAGAELFRLAEQWHVRSLWRMTGYLWELA